MLNSNNLRELCYLIKIDEIMPIPGYDRVELAKTGGWCCIVPKGQFKEGSIGIYFEIDSRVDSTNPVFAFMEKRHYKVKTIKMCGVYSQGLIMAPEDFGWKVNDNGNVITPTGIHSLEDESRFLTKELKVTYADPEDNTRKANADPNAKYTSMKARHRKIFSNPVVKKMMKYRWFREFMFFFFGKRKDKPKGFPTHLPHIHKSDEERVENMPWILQNKTRWIKTTKIDGTSSLYLLERKKGKAKYEYWVCSRNVRQLTPAQSCYHEDNVYWEVDTKYHIYDFLRDMLETHPEWDYVALQGETAGCSSSGAPIQGDPHKFGELRFFGYNFITSDIGRWNSIKAAELCSAYGIEWVPIIDDNYILPDDLEEFKLSADGDCEAPGASGLREGYVYRNYDDNTLSFKNVSRVYLTKRG